MTVDNVSRRGFLKGLVGTGLVLGVRWPASLQAALAADESPWSPNVFLAIDGDGLVTIVAHRSEMGTGIRTALPTVVADELGADWGRVRIEQALGDERYGSQNTDGSRSVRRFYVAMREAGATARRMLETAAARIWDVDPDDCIARDHAVLHPATSRRLDFGALVEAARDLPLPAADELAFRSPREWRYVGRDVPLVDGEDIAAGRATFGMDARLDGMKIAMVERCPVLGGRVRRYDEAAALDVPGVEAVLELTASRPPHGFQALGGVAVVAGDTWSALQGRAALAVEWAEGANAAYDTTTYLATLAERARRAGEVVREHGDVDAALAAADRIVEADYALPHLAHASMEPPCALANVTDGGAEIWAPTQNPQAARDMVAVALGIDRENVDVHVTLLGGGFGRKSKPDYVVEAALLSSRVGAPVKVVWTREDDIRHDYYHAIAALHLRASLDADGRPTGWLQRSVFPPISSTFRPDARRGSAGELGLGFTDIPYALPSLRCEVGEAEAHVRIGWLRSVCNVFHAFALGSFTDELAAAAGRDPLAYLLELLGPDRRIDLVAEGVEYDNYGEPLADYPIDTGRLRHVTELVARESGWGRSLPRGRALGIAAHRSFLSYVATVVEVDVAPDGTIAIPRVDMALDCGLAIHPDRVRAQMEGSAVFGASLALTGEITARAGRVEQGNFHDYPVARMGTAPREVHVHLVESEALPAGVGEPGVPPIAPALCNALFAATGKRVRSLPLSRHDLSWS